MHEVHHLRIMKKAMAQLSQGALEYALEEVGTWLFILETGLRRGGLASCFHVQ